MGKAIWSLAAANIRHKKGSFLSILIIMLMVCAMTTTALNVHINRQMYVDDLFTKIRSGDLYLWLPSQLVDEDSLEEAQALSEVKKLQTVPLIFASDSKKTTIKGKDPELILQFQTYDLLEHPYSIFNKTFSGFEEGREPADGEIFVPISFRQTFSVSLGESIEIDTGESVKEYQIAAFLEEPTLGNPVVGGFKNVFVNSREFADLQAAQQKHPQQLIAFDAVQVFKAEEIEDAKFSAILNDHGRWIDQSTTSITKSEFKNYTSIMTNVFNGVIFGFSFLLFAVILLVVAHAITTAIQEDYKDLGILKSQGFSTVQIRLAYLIKFVLAAMIGAAAGFGGGYFLTILLSHILVNVSGILLPTVFHWGPAIVLQSIMILIILLFTLLNTIRIGSITPLEAISPVSAVARKVQHGFAIRKRWMGTALSFRQLLNGIKMYLASLAITALLVFFIITVSSLLSAMDEENILKEFYGFTFDLEVQDILQEERMSEIDEKIRTRSAIAEKKGFESRFFTIEEQSVQGNIVEKPEDFCNITEGRPPSQATEIAITKVLADYYGVKIGDILSIHLGDVKKNFEISGYYQNINMAGRQFSLLESGMKRLEPDFQFRGFHYLLEDAQQASQVKRDLDEAFPTGLKMTTVADVLTNIKSITQVATGVTFGVYLLSIFLVAVVVAMIATTVFYREKRDYGILKAVGMDTLRLRFLFAFRFLMIGLTGSLFGLLLSLLLSERLLSLVLRGMGITNFMLRYDWMNLGIPMASITLSLLLTAFLVSGKIRRVDPKFLLQEAD